MADWLTIPDESVDPDSPVVQALLRALRDNPIAISEGSSGAPKIQNNAFADGSISTSKLTGFETSVANSIIGFGAGGVGTYAMLKGFTDYGLGSTEAGSALRYSAAISQLGYDSTSTLSGVETIEAPSGGTPSGTWRCMGQTGTSTSASGTLVALSRLTLWLRIA